MTIKKDTKYFVNGKIIKENISNLEKADANKPTINLEI